MARVAATVLFLVLCQACSAQSPYELLSGAHQKLVERVAEYCYIDSEGDIWSNKIEATQDKTVRPGTRDYEERKAAYESKDSPRWYCLTTGERASSRYAVLQAIADRKNSQIRRERDRYLRANRLVYAEQFQVLQVVADGLLGTWVSGGTEFGERILLVGHPQQGRVVDNDVIAVACACKSTGRYQYTSTAGATRTIQRWEYDSTHPVGSLYPLRRPDEFELSRVDADELAAALFRANLNRLPQWRLKRLLVKKGVPAKYKVVQKANSGGYITKRKQKTHDAIPAVYDWQFELKHIRLRFDRDP